MIKLIGIDLLWDNNNAHSQYLSLIICTLITAQYILYFSREEEVILNFWKFICWANEKSKGKLGKRDYHQPFGDLNPILFQIHSYLTVSSAVSNCLHDFPDTGNEPFKGQSEIDQSEASIQVTWPVLTNQRPEWIQVIIYCVNILIKENPLNQF